MSRSPVTFFDGTAEDYRRHRPSYPPALLDWIEADLGRVPRRVLDLGCGTGILTEMVARRGWPVVGVEPNPEMLGAARENSSVDLVRGQAEATGLRDASVDLVVCGQAFHWFEQQVTLAELDRVLTPGGRVCAVWNLRDHGRGIGEDYHAIMERFSRDYRGQTTFVDGLRARVAGRGLVEHRLENDHEVSLETLLGRARSASYVAHGVGDLAGLEAALTAAFEARAVDGVVSFPYETVALLWGSLSE